jgi:hypothetical protein
MSTLGKLVQGAMGALRPRPPVGDAAPTIELPPPDPSGGAGLLEALGKRRSSREYRNDPLPMPLLSTLLWTANGVNRADGGRTAPSALDAREAIAQALGLAHDQEVLLSQTVGFGKAR